MELSGIIKKIMSKYTEEELAEMDRITKEIENDPTPARPAFEIDETDNITHSKLTLTALRRFIKWTTSRYNECKKADVVRIAKEMIENGNGITTFECGAYTPSSTMSHGYDYLVNGEKRYIAKGVYRYHNNVFVEQERIQF